MNSIRLQVPEENSFINIGVDVDDMFIYFDINFIKNPHYWGISIINPDGDREEDIVIPYNEYELSYEFEYEEKKYEIVVMRTDSYYEIIWNQE